MAIESIERLTVQLGRLPGIGRKTAARLAYHILGVPEEQAQRMQENMQKKQAELNAREFSAASGGGMVKVTVNGAREVLSVEIDPQCVDPDDVEMLQDLVLSAVNGALKEAAATVEQEMGKLTGGMNMPF